MYYEVVYKEKWFMVQTAERQVEIRSLKGKLLAAYEY